MTTIGVPRSTLSAQTPDVIVERPRYVARFTIPYDSIVTGSPNGCTFASALVSSTVAAPSTTEATHNTTDSIAIKIDGGPSGDAQGKTPTTLKILINGIVTSTIEAGTSPAEISTEDRAIAGSVVAVKRADAAEDRMLCIDVVEPKLIGVLKVGGDQTSFIADGAIGTALRTGVGGSTLTGSLGILHRSVKIPGSRGGLPLARPLAGELLRAIISVASSVDTLRSDTHAAFVQAILSPSFAGGAEGSALVDYYNYKDRGAGAGTQGYHLLFSVERLQWRFAPNAIDSVPISIKTDTLAHPVSIIGLDMRYRFSFLDHPSDEKGNTFAFWVEAGPAIRWIPGASGRDSSFKLRTLGTTSNLFLGGVLQIAVQLRQVTATVDLPFLSHLTNEFSPTIGFKFDAPFFVF
jgi:hypothetical protein